MRLTSFPHLVFCSNVQVARDFASSIVALDIMILSSFISFCTKDLSDSLNNLELPKLCS